MDLSYLARELSAIRQRIEVLAIAVESEQLRSKWLSAPEVCELLGSGFTPYILRNKVKNNHFTYGVEYKDTSDGDKPNYVFKVSAVDAYFDLEPAKRKPRG